MVGAESALAVGLALPCGFPESLPQKPVDAARVGAAALGGILFEVDRGVELADQLFRLHVSRTVPDHRADVGVESRIDVYKRQTSRFVRYSPW